MIKRDNSARNIAILLFIASLIAIFLFASKIGDSEGSAIVQSSNNFSGDSYAVLHIYNTIQDVQTYDSVSYNHSFLMNYVDTLIEDETNKGILLLVNSGGGTVYHSDEMYLKLMEYKEETGREIYAYFEGTAASGAYYISCAAGEIYANRNTRTGSIGVIISYLDLTQLYEKLGIEQVMITSGPNKGMGASELTQEQYDIYQATVDESYQQFTSIVSESRDIPLDTLIPIADGRIYTANQAVNNGLIDGITSYEDMLGYVSDELSAQPNFVYYNHPTESVLDNLSPFLSSQTDSELELIKEIIDGDMSGVPLYMYIQ